jgi:CBS domain-containing protein
MKAVTEPLMNLTAGDLMTCDVIRLSETMSLREAAGLLLKNQISGAPVVDAHGTCIGVLTALDFLHLTEKYADSRALPSPPLPVSCSFQIKHRTSVGQEITLCTLPPGVCPIQAKHQEHGSEPLLVCSQPHCVLVDWQIVDLERLPEGEVRRYMTSDPVTVPANTSIRTLARMIIDAHIHRVIVVDESRMPIGIVTSTDLLAAVAYSDASRDAPGNLHENQKC